MVVSIVDKIADGRPNSKAGKINVDEEAEPASQLGIMSILTPAVIEKGKSVNQAKGVRTKEEILGML